MRRSRDAPSGNLKASKDLRCGRRMGRPDEAEGVAALRLCRRDDAMLADYWGCISTCGRRGYEWPKAVSTHIWTKRSFSWKGVWRRSMRRLRQRPAVCPTSLGVFLRFGGTEAFRRDSVWIRHKDEGDPVYGMVSPLNHRSSARRKLGILAPVEPANADLEAAGRAFHADIMAQAHRDIRRWGYAPATTVHRMVGDGRSDVVRRRDDKRSRSSKE
jgi:hypothetical protein